MSKFNALVKSIIQESSKKFESAETDFNNVIQEVETSLKDVLEDFYFETDVIEDAIEGRYYRVQAVPLPNDHFVGKVRINDFFIPSNGYPMTIGKYNPRSSDFSEEAKLNNKAEIEDIFEKMLSTPESRLVQTIGFALRRKNIDDIPF
ncbi:hypothetical protein ACJJWD_13770 [Comamonas testosteroni]|uniref:hypothetical protein n=1 Tax=Comamonas testosteroni TaxID=285 RepID=UPI003899D948